jgi:hypothetical protein
LLGNPLLFIPSLALLARHLFPIPVTAPGGERQFSTVELTITERRFRLDPDTVHNILFVRSIQNVLDSKPDFFLNIKLFYTCSQRKLKCIELINVSSSHFIFIDITFFSFYDA